jgi:hypothetical protein
MNPNDQQRCEDVGNEQGRAAEWLRRRAGRERWARPVANRRRDFAAGTEIDFASVLITLTTHTGRYWKGRIDEMVGRKEEKRVSDREREREGARGIWVREEL